MTLQEYSLPSRRPFSPSLKLLGTPRLLRNFPEHEERGACDAKTPLVSGQTPESDWAKARVSSERSLPKTEMTLLVLSRCHTAGEGDDERSRGALDLLLRTFSLALDKWH